MKRSLGRRKPGILLFPGIGGICKVNGQWRLWYALSYVQPPPPPAPSSPLHRCVDAHRCLPSGSTMDRPVPVNGKTARGVPCAGGVSSEATAPRFRALRESSRQDSGFTARDGRREQKGGREQTWWWSWGSGAWGFHADGADRAREGRWGGPALAAADGAAVSLFPSVLRSLVDSEC